MTSRPFSGRKRRPEGVNEALWAYATSQRLADDETSAFADHPLIKADLKWVKAKLGNGNNQIVADLGCGSGRASAWLAEIGWQVISVDLSRPMLEKFMEEQGGLTDSHVLPVQGNLARLEFIPSVRLDAAVCLFSTLGMIPLKIDRQRFLRSVSMALNPGGVLLIHAHNWWVQKNHNQGIRWMIRDLWRRMIRDKNYGNRDAQYRGIPGVKIHMFGWNEIESELNRVGLQVKTVVNLNATTAEDIGDGFITQRILAGGWLIEATRN